MGETTAVGSQPARQLSGGAVGSEDWKADFSKAPQPEVPTPDTTRRGGPAPDLLDLSAAERVVRLKIGGRAAHHVFRRLTLEDWMGFLKEGHTEILVEGETTMAESEEAAAALRLWERAILRVDGYRVGDDWKEKIPPAHKIAAVDLLQEVAVLPGGEDPFDLESETRAVKLEANWNLRIYSDLIHRFRPPSESDQLKYSRLMSEFYRKRGRSGKVARISAPPKLKQLCALYDELAQSVEGYSLISSVREMDPLHKQAAVLALFAGPEQSSDE